MPIYLEFKHKRTIKAATQETIDFPTIILNMASLSHIDAEVTQEADINGNLIVLKLMIKGISVIDPQSAHLLAAMIGEKLDETQSLFYLSSYGRTEYTPGDTLFLHSKFKPGPSRNSKFLACIPGFEAAEKYCCPLSGDVIDHPVYDVRSPNTIYDYEFLIYWLNTSYPKLMPHTKLPFHKSFLREDFDLKSEISQYVKNQLEGFEQSRLKELLAKYKLADKDGASLNKALLLSIGESEDTEELQNDLHLLFRFGVDINYQDEATQSRSTALHLALHKSYFNSALTLLTCGARIDIQDSKNITAFHLIITSSRQNERFHYVSHCQAMGLISISPLGEISLVRKPPLRPLAHLGSPITAAGDAHALLKHQLNHILANDKNRGQLEPIEKSIDAKNYAQALRRACNYNDCGRVLPLIEKILAFKDKLNIKINEQTGQDQYAALHYAAKMVAKHRDRSIYNLLVQHGAKEDLLDKAGRTPAEHLADNSPLSPK